MSVRWSSHRSFLIWWTLKFKKPWLISLKLMFEVFCKCVLFVAFSVQGVAIHSLAKCLSSLSFIFCVTFWITVHVHSQFCPTTTYSSAITSASIICSLDFENSNFLPLSMSSAKTREWNIEMNYWSKLCIWKRFLDSLIVIH